MRTIVLDILVRTKTAISHNGGEKAGNMGLFRRETKFYKKGDQHTNYQCPVVSANSLRSILRKAASSIYLDSLGEEGRPHKVSVPVGNMLMSGGGQVNKKEKIDGNIGFFKEVREQMPSISLFGTSKGNTMISGKTDVYQLLPIGRETMHILPESIKESIDKHFGSVNSSVKSYMNLIFKTTKDWKNEEALKKYLDSSEVSEEDKESLLMLYYTEVLAAGVPMYWKIALRDVTDVEYSLFMASLMKVKSLANIGGKHSNGRGEIEYLEIFRTDKTKLGEGVSYEQKVGKDLFLSSVEEGKEGMISFIGRL